MENFFACVSARKDPIMSVEAGHSVATLCHLGNIARRLGRRLHWDPAREIFPGDDEPQAVAVFQQLQEILSKVGSDMRHLVKGTYYVSDDDAARWVDRTRLRVFDPLRPPAASKLMVHGVGLSQRTMTVDMIAVEMKP